MHTRTEEQNQREFKAIVDEGKVPGLLAYLDGEPVGWCSVGLQRDYGRFFSETEAEPVWLIACFFLRGSHRGRGIGRALLEAAVVYAAERGAVAVEGLLRGWRPSDDPASLESLVRMFHKAGFRDVTDPKAPAMMRKDV
jgi:GNAT superfamily N-acetyltransferase